MRGFIVGLLVGIVLTIGLGVFALAAIGHALAIEDPLEKADAIVAISGDTAVIMRREALRQGVPENATLIEPASATTEDNATEVAKLMVDRRLRSAILVTSPYHQRRADMLFKRAFEPAGIVLRNYPARDLEWDPNLWWVRDPLRSRTLIELAKLAAEIVRPAMTSRARP